MAPYKNMNETGAACSLHRDIFQRYNDDANSIFSRLSLNDDKFRESNKWPIRQSNQTPEKGSQSPNLSENADFSAPTQNSPPAPPAPPAPPPPPPPALNGGTIPTMRLRSEIPARGEPPAKIQSAMMKDKKPFTYTPGGIDLSQIKSPRMQRRIVRNAQEPEDIVLPPTSAPLNANSLPPSAVAAMMPQIAIPVFPQNGFEKKNSNVKHTGNPPPPPPPPKTHNLGSSPVPRKSPSPTPISVNQTPVSSPSPQPVKTVSSNRGPEQNSALVNEIKSKTAAHDPTRTQVGSLYIPPVVNDDSAKAKQTSPPLFPTLREAPTPWLQKHQQQPESVPVWMNRNNQNNEAKVEEPKPHTIQINVNKNSDADRMSNGAHIIPIKIEGASQKSQQNNRPNPSQRWGNNRENNEIVQPNNTRATKQNSEPDSKPIQSRSFRVLQKITGSEDDSADLNANIPYNTEGVPLSQLRKLRLNDDDKEFMNKVKAQGYHFDELSNDVIDSTNNLDWVDDDTFLHMETDPRYRGSVIPSRAFRMLQNMTDSGQVTSNNVVIIPVGGATQSHPVPNSTEIYTRTNEKPVAASKEIETKKNYIPPSERQAEQELRKYMGSSIPSRSFRMLQAMTAAQDSTENVRAGKTDEETKLLTPKAPFYPNPWLSPPRTAQGVRLLWQNYLYLYDLVFHRFPDVFVQDCYDPEGPCRDPQNSTNIKIIVTDENESGKLEIGSKTNIANMMETFSNNIDDIKKNELIIKGVVKDEEENDVSLTVCIPLRRKGKPCEEYHSEVTLGDFVASKNHSSDELGDEARSLDSVPADNGTHESTLQTRCDKKESESPAEDDEDTHSDASSVDFWKEIVDNEDDLFYRSLRNKPDENSVVSGQEDQPAHLMEDKPASSRRVQWHIGDDVRHYCPYTFLSDSSNDSSSNSSSSTDPNAVRENETGASDNTFSTESETSGENGYCNVYEFPRYSKAEPNDPNKGDKSQNVHDLSDAEDDSGMNSDAGQNFSETDMETELKKLSSGLNTHSRLYKLLLAEQKRRNESENEKQFLSRKGSSTLPLNLSFTESCSSSSGINSPMSLTNERLSYELLQSVLKGKEKDKLDRQWRSWLREMAVKSIQTENADRSRDSSRSSPYFNEEMWRERSQTDSPCSLLSSSEFHELTNEFDKGFKVLQCDRSSPVTWPRSPLLSQNDTRNPLSKCDKSQDGCYKR